MANTRYQSFKEFYPHYLKEHSNKTNRILHYIGTTIVIILMIFALYSQRYQLFWLLPIAGYSFAWLGHFVFEKNKPATFKYPIWSLFSDFLMLYHFLTGQLASKMQKD